MDLEQQIATLKEAKARRDRALAMRQDGKKLREIAAALEVSIEGARQMVNRAAAEQAAFSGFEAKAPEELKN